jgi:predicted phosphodiesterase
LFGDSRNRDKPLWAIMEDLRKRKDMRFAVHTGDVVVNKHRKDKFEKYLDKIEDMPFPVYTCKGNHDFGLFEEYAIDEFETWKYNGFHRPDRFLKLNNANDHWGIEQKEFIKRWMDTNNRNFVFCHKPLDDVVFPDGRRTSHIMGEKPNGNKDAQWLRKYGYNNNLEFIGAGHYHAQAIQMLRENIVTVLEGRAGAPMYGNEMPFGYSIIYVWPDSWTVQRVDVSV